MFRIDNQSAVLVMPSPGAVGPNPDGYFRTGNPTTPIWPTSLDADFLNAVQEEICYCIEQESITLSKTDRTQLKDAIDLMIAAGAGAGTPGMANVEADTSPSLGGNFKVNNKSFVSVSNGNIVVAPHGTGAIDFNASSILVHTDLQHRGDTDNKIVFGTDTQNFRTGGTSRFNISDLGLQIGSGSRVTAILDEDDMASNSATAITTQQAAKAYVDNIVDIFNEARFSFYLYGFTETSIVGGSTYYFFRGSATTVLAIASGGASRCVIPGFYRISPFGLGNIEYPSITYSDLYVFCGQAPGSAQTYTATLMDSNSASTITATISGASSFIASDTTHTLTNSVNSPKNLRLRIETSAGATTLTRLSWRLKATINP